MIEGLKLKDQTSGRDWRGGTRRARSVGAGRLGARRLGAGRLGASIILFAAAALGTSAFQSSWADDPAGARSIARMSISPRQRTEAFGIPQVAYINQAIRQGWIAHGLRPSSAATEGEWCRRVFLDILGRIPSVDELTQFLNDRSSDKRLKLVNRLLSDEYVEDYSRNWSNIWTTLLLGRPPAVPDNNSLVNRDGMEKYLRDSFAFNKPYDQMVRELIAATGTNKPGEEDFNGAVNFLIGNLEDDGVNATAKTAKLFLGLQVQCTQCHDHPFNDWKQNQFWELNAFFRQTDADRKSSRQVRPPIASLVDKDFRGQGGDASEAILFYELRNGQMKSAFPVFVDGREISHSGRLREVNRRQELSRLVIDSEYFGQAIVNRMWGHFFGYGFTKPVDDFGPHNPPTHPELLSALAADFAAQSHDLKQLIRWIVLSEPYSLSSKVLKGRNDKDDPSVGAKPMFSHFYLRQMRAEELYESLLVATEADQSRGSLEEQQRMKEDWLRQFTIAFGTDEGDDATTFNGTIPQTLMMFNGELVRTATSVDSGGFLDRIAKDQKLNNMAKINHLFMATLARRPTGAEIAWANQLVLARRGNTVAAMQDVFWVLLNTAEFIFNH